MSAEPSEAREPSILEAQDKKTQQNHVKNSRAVNDRKRLIDINISLFYVKNQHCRTEAL